MIGLKGASLYSRPRIGLTLRPRSVISSKDKTNKQHGANSGGFGPIARMRRIPHKKPLC
jgi:hypothetical protein